MRTLCEYGLSRCEGMTPPDCLKALLDVLILWHGKDTQLIVKDLRSLPDCPQQAFHSDCECGVGNKKR